MRYQESPFTGPATFYKAPHRPDADRGEAHVGILGVPYDHGGIDRPGARFGPAALREASGRYALPAEGFHDPDSGRNLLGGARLVDVGDVGPAPHETDECFERVTTAARRLRTVARLPAFVGGDHSVSLPLLRAFDDVPELHVVQLDAHLAFSDSREGERATPANVFRQAVAAAPNLSRIVTVGVRELLSGREALEAARARGHALISARRLRADPGDALAALPERASVYLSVDVDVLDPALVPGTGRLEPDGLAYAEAIAVIDRVVERNRLVGLELVELAPNLDPSGRSQRLAARLLLDGLSAWWNPARMG